MLKTASFCGKHLWKRPLSTRPHINYDDQTKSFLSVFPEVLQTIMKSEFFPQVPEYEKYFTDVIDYNVMKEKRFRPPLMLETYKILEKPENLTEENLNLANIVAWCIELIQSYMNMEDDTMDQSEHRCDDICWHKKENVGLVSFKDSIFLYEAAFILLKKYFYGKPTYLPFAYLFQEMNRQLIVGQSLDWHWKVNKKLDFSKFNTELYSMMGRNKGGFTIVESPVQSGCLLSNNYSKFPPIKDLIRRISYVFQVDNDVLDVFQDGRIKIDAGENIRQGQCTWMAVHVLENGSEDLKQVFKENYGRTGSEFEKKITDIYYELDLFNKYLEYRKANLNYVIDAVSQIEDLSLQKAILNLYNHLFL